MNRQLLEEIGSLSLLHSNPSALRFILHNGESRRDTHSRREGWQDTACCGFRYEQRWYTLQLLQSKSTGLTWFTDREVGSFTYKHATGYNVLGDEKPITEDAVFLLASQTKLLTSIAALQVVENGLIGLDDDVAGQLPELAEQPILKGFDDKDEPILEKRKNTITLRYRILRLGQVRSLLTRPQTSPHSFSWCGLRCHGSESHKITTEERSCTQHW